MKATDELALHFRLTKPQQSALKRLKIVTLSDLLYHFPARYGNELPRKQISELVSGDKVSIYGTLENTKTKKAFRRKMPMAEGTLRDDTGSIGVIWFHQAYMAKKVPPGAPVRVSGTVGTRNGNLYIANPELEPVASAPAGEDSLFTEEDDARLLSVYPESRGVTSLWLSYAIRKTIKGLSLGELPDVIPTDILKRYNLPTLETALVWIHTPKKLADAEVARKRFAFEEIFKLQLSRGLTRNTYHAHKSFLIDIKESDLAEFVERFPFDPTKAQHKAIKNILDDMKTPGAMTRLLEGDVGSGKTAVAASTAYGIVTTRPNKPADAGGYGEAKQDFGNLQVAYMAPTEILARQHFESFIEYFRHLPIQIGLITGSECRKFPSKVDPGGHTHISRTQLLKWVKNGEIPILIGTHALIQKSVEFKDLGYVIIDEQHRFGVTQRAKLTNKDERVPHLLSMTATPIPRTLALTIYGDLDLTLLDELPKGRKAIKTEIANESDRSEVYRHLESELKKGRQAYVICPRINEPDPSKEQSLQLKSATAEQERLQNGPFKDYVVGLVHSKLTAKKKEEVMEQFTNGEIDILVSTSVVEVGVNVPNATTIIIEGAERFGLSQLHQLRGRVLRSSHQAYCYLFTSNDTGGNNKRLKALKSAKNGFELSEEDLKLRGPGVLSGTKQWGISDLGMEAIKNIKMVEAARTEATKLLETDPNLNKNPLLKEVLESSELPHLE